MEETPIGQEHQEGGDGKEEFEVIEESEVEEAKPVEDKIFEKEAKHIDEAIAKAKEDDSVSSLDAEAVAEELVQLRNDFREWTSIRALTISTLREIADYIDLVSKRTGIAKIASSGGGALAGGLTLIGGALTIATAGAALPVLLAGTGIGLAAGIGGGAAAITEKIIKSKQMKAAEAALSEDEAASKHLEEKVIKIRENKYVKGIAKDLVKSGAGAASDSMFIASLVSNSGVGLGKIGGEVVAKVFGEDIGKEVSKLFLQTSGRVLTGTVTVVLGGVTMLYDIYRLNAEVTEIAKLGQKGASEIRTIADQLEEALKGLC